MSLLLNLERPQDAMDYWEPGSPLQAQLTADEVRKERLYRVLLRSKKEGFGQKHGRSLAQGAVPQVRVRWAFCHVTLLYSLSK